jgi:site-specific recombinase XerD
MSQPRLLDEVRTTARLRHLSLKTEKAYVQQIKRFILFHDKKHPREMNEGHIRDYLSHLAMEKNVSASTQKRRSCRFALLVLDVLRQKLDRIEEGRRSAR